MLLASLCAVADAAQGGATPPNSPSLRPALLGGHTVRLDAQGHLLPWISWSTALEREMHFYQQCPAAHGYPLFVSETFLDGNWTPDPARPDTIPATQNGLGVISYLKMYARTHEPAYLDER
jgi:hypothetical protein